MVLEPTALNSFAKSEAEVSRCSRSRCASAAATRPDHLYCTAASTASSTARVQHTARRSRDPADPFICQDSSEDVSSRQRPGKTFPVSGCANGYVPDADDNRKGTTKIREKRFVLHNYYRELQTA